MEENQKILFLVAFVYVIGFFTPLIELITSMSSFFGGASSANTWSIFNVFTTTDKVFNFKDPQPTQVIGMIFIVSFIAMPILTCIIALMKSYNWLFAIAFPFVILSCSVIYLIVNAPNNLYGQESDIAMGVRVSWGWALIIIPSLILIVIAIISMIKEGKQKN